MHIIIERTTKKVDFIEMTHGEYYAIKMLSKYSILNGTYAAQKILGISASKARQVVETLLLMP